MIKPQLIKIPDGRIIRKEHNLSLKIPIRKQFLVFRESVNVGDLMDSSVGVLYCKAVYDAPVWESWWDILSECEVTYE